MNNIFFDPNESVNGKLIHKSVKGSRVEELRYNVVDELDKL